MSSKRFNFDCDFSEPFKTPTIRLCSVTQLCLTLCGPMDCGLLGSSVHGIFQVRILEWVVVSYSSHNSFQDFFFAFSFQQLIIEFLHVVFSE